MSRGEIKESAVTIGIYKEAKDLQSLEGPQEPPGAPQDPEGAPKWRQGDQRPLTPSPTQDFGFLCVCLTLIRGPQIRTGQSMKLNLGHWTMGWGAMGEPLATLGSFSSAFRVMSKLLQTTGFHCTSDHLRSFNPQGLLDNISRLLARSSLASTSLKGSTSADMFGFCKRQKSVNSC